MSDFSTIPEWKVQAFVIISEEMHALEQKAVKRGKHGG